MGLTLLVWLVYATAAVIQLFTSGAKVLDSLPPFWWWGIPLAPYSALYTPWVKSGVQPDVQPAAEPPQPPSTRETLMAQRTAKLWSALGTPKTVRVISVGMLVYLLVIGMLTYGYARVSDCLAVYADKSAVSTNARAKAAAEDRQADQAERDITEAERQRLVANDIALDKVLAAMGKDDRDVTQEAFANLIAVRADTAKQRQLNDVKRADLAEQRQQTELNRRMNPVPPPPSQTC
jgi:hypothetical protein